MKKKIINKPNIVFILSDDQGAWALGSAGNHEIRTPHLDHLAKEGMRFSNFFCTSPLMDKPMLKPFLRVDAIA